MAYDAELADRLRECLQDQPDLSEKRMFGGLGFMLAGHMAVAAGSNGGLMVRCDPERGDELTTRPGCSRMVMRGKEMAGWLTVDPAALEDDAALGAWVEVGSAFVRTLPAKVETDDARGEDDPDRTDA